MLGPGGMEGKTGLDLYAGTGSVGIEMLRRGAERVDFVEVVRSRAGLISRAIEREGYESISAVHRMDAMAALNRLKGRTFDIVFADPPYEINPAEQIVRTLRRNRMLEPGAWIILEHSTRLKLPDSLDGASTIRKRRYGDSAITVYSIDRAATDEHMTRR